MARSILNEFKLELSLLVFVASCIGLSWVIPGFFFPTWEHPWFAAYKDQIPKAGPWVLIGAAIGFLGGGYYLYASASKHWRFRRLMKESNSRAALKRNIKELEELALDLPSWRHRELDEKRKKYGLK